HHGENHDERGDTQAHAQQRHPGDEGHEKLVGAGAHVAQPDEQGQGIQHRGGLWAKNLTEITKALLDIVGSRRQRLTLPYRGVYCRQGREEKAMLARTMKMSLVAIGLALAAPSFAETLAVDGQLAIKPAGVETPQRGSTMAAVEAKFGAPA